MTTVVRVLQWLPEFAFSFVAVLMLIRTDDQLVAAILVGSLVIGLAIERATNTRGMS